MSSAVTIERSKSESKSEHFEVLIVGAGISGIGGAYHLARQCPDRSFVVLESQESFGGTWLTHKYPGIRSD
ncbi:MAG TPA: NAD(P)-binding protein, partial [Rhizomicrobium sp.]